MNMLPAYYTIVGYDLSKYRNEILNFINYDEEYFEDWYEKWTCYQSKDNVQLFLDDPSGIKEFCYFGYILDCKDDYNKETEKFDLINLQRQKTYVDAKLHELGWTLPREPIPYQLINFVVYR